MGGESICKEDGKNGDGDGGNDVYKGKTEPALVSVSDSYSEDKEISVCDSGSSSSPAYTITDYFYQLATALRKKVNDFVLRRTFYSRQLF